MWTVVAGIFLYQKLLKSGNPFSFTVQSIMLGPFYVRKQLLL